MPGGAYLRGMATHAPNAPSTVDAPRPPVHARTVTVLMSVVVILVVGMQAAINLAVPEIAGGPLRPSATEVLWIVDAYIVAFAALLVPAGALGDRFGRRELVVAGAAVFAIGCAICAGATTTPVMLAGRVVTGIGAAGALPNTLAVMMATAAPERRPRAIGVWASMTGVGGVVGNVGAGVVLDVGSVDLLFVVFAAVAAVAAIGTRFLTPAIAGHDLRQDPVGIALVATAMVALVGAIIEGPQRGWGSPEVIAAFVAAGLVTVAFVAWELRREHPVLDPRVFRIAPVRLASILVALLSVGMFGLFFVNAQYLEQVKGYSLLQTGLAIGPMAVVMLLASRASSAVVTRIGVRWTVAGGLLLVSCGLLGFSTNDESTTYATYIASLVVLAVGFGLAIAALSVTIVTGLPARLAGLGAGLNGATRELGSAIGVALVGTLVNARFAADLPEGLVVGQGAGASTVLQRLAEQPGRAQAVDAFVPAVASGMHVVAAVVAVGALVCVLPPGRSLSR